VAVLCPPDLRQRALSLGTARPADGLFTSKAHHDGQTVLAFTTLEFLDRLAALVPSPRRHRHRYHGVLPPNAPSVLQ
jgi:hypothetical protein